MTAVNPETVAAPRGYSNGVLLPAGRMLFIAGQVAWDRDANLVPGGFPEQFGQALYNVVEVVKAAGGGPENIGQLTIFVTDKMAYVASLKEVGAFYRAHMGKSFPAMALVEVAGLLEAGAMVEIQGWAVIP